MIYLNSRPITRHANSNAPKRRFEWRDFVQNEHRDTEESVALLRERFEFQQNLEATDDFFLLPGRANQIAKLNHDETFEIKTLVDESGPLELWETTVKSKVPMRRTLAKMIASRIPKFSGPVVGSMTPQELSDSLSRKTRFFRVTINREIFKLGDVTAKISRTYVDDVAALSIALESPRAEPLLAELKALGLRKRENTNYGAYLLNAA